MEELELDLKAVATQVVRAAMTLNSPAPQHVQDIAMSKLDLWATLTGAVTLEAGVALAAQVSRHRGPVTAAVAPF